MKRIQPARPGLRVRGPDGALLPPDGANVEWNTHWERRLRDGDIIEPRPEPPPDAIRTLKREEKSSA